MVWNSSLNLLFLTYISQQFDRLLCYIFSLAYSSSVPLLMTLGTFHGTPSCPSLVELIPGRCILSVKDALLFKTKRTNQRIAKVHGTIERFWCEWERYGTILQHVHGTWHAVTLEWFSYDHEWQTYGTDLLHEHGTTSETLEWFSYEWER